MSRLDCERCERAPAVVEAVDGTRLCQTCSAFLPKTTPLVETPEIPAGYVEILTHDGHRIARHEESGALVGLAPAEGWIPVGLVVGATAEQLTVACGSCRGRPPRRRDRTPWSGSAKHYFGRTIDRLTQVRSPEHPEAGGLLVVDPFGWQDRTPMTPLSGR